MECRASCASRRGVGKFLGDSHRLSAVVGAPSRNGPDGGASSHAPTSCADSRRE